MDLNFLKFQNTVKSVFDILIRYFNDGEKV